jgi:hypothetical protein
MPLRAVSERIEFHDASFSFPVLFETPRPNVAGERIYSTACSASLVATLVATLMATLMAATRMPVDGKRVGGGERQVLYLHHLTRSNKKSV